AGAGFDEKPEGWKGDAPRPRAGEEMNEHRQADPDQAEEHPGIGEGRPVHNFSAPFPGPGSNSSGSRRDRPTFWPETSRNPGPGSGPGPDADAPRSAGDKGHATHRVRR